MSKGKYDWTCPLCKKIVTSKLQINRVKKDNKDLNYTFDLPIGAWCCVDCFDMQMKRNATQREQLKKEGDEKNG